MKLSIDLGGTHVRIAQVEEGRCLNKTLVSCPAQQEASAILGLLSRLISEQMNERVEGIGIGVPSVVDADKGIVYNVANIASWKEIHLKDILEKEFGVPVMVNNDSNCFALGVKQFGEGKSYADMVGVTIGTGIGAGVIINHRLHGGILTGAGEIGSLPYLDADFEQYCSSFFFKRYHTTGAQMTELAHAGDESALQLWSEFGGHLGNMMKAILFTYAPQAIVLGGGMAPAFSLFRKGMEEAMCDFPYQTLLKLVRIEASRLEDAALLGASALIN